MHSFISAKFLGYVAFGTLNDTFAILNVSFARLNVSFKFSSWGAGTSPAAPKIHQSIYYILRRHRCAFTARSHLALS